MAGNRFEEIVGSVDALPTLPTVVAKVNELVDDTSVSAGDINEVISHDIALSSKILKLVNSAYYGFPRRISSITHAVVILGFQTIRNIAVSAFVLDAFEGGGTLFGHRGFWIHSVGVGVAANVVGQRQRLPASEEAFMCGLLHDVGKLVLNQFARKDFARVLELARAEDITVLEAEGRVLGTSHAEVGAMLLERWKLPQRMVAAIGGHHRPESAPEEARVLTAAIHVGDIVTRALLVGSGGDEKIPTVSAEAWTALGLSEEALPGMLQEISSDMTKVGAFIELVQASKSAR